MDKCRLTKELLINLILTWPQILKGLNFIKIWLWVSRLFVSLSFFSFNLFANADVAANGNPSKFLPRAAVQRFSTSRWLLKISRWLCMNVANSQPFSSIPNTPVKSLLMKIKLLSTLTFSLAKHDVAFISYDILNLSISIKIIKNKVCWLVEMKEISGPGIFASYVIVLLCSGNNIAFIRAPFKAGRIAKSPWLLWGARVSAFVSLISEITFLCLLKLNIY